MIENFAQSHMRELERYAARQQVRLREVFETITDPMLRSALVDAVGGLGRFPVEAGRETVGVGSHLEETARALASLGLCRPVRLEPVVLVLCEPRVVEAQSNRCRLAAARMGLAVVETHRVRPGADLQGDLRQERLIARVGEGQLAGVVTYRRMTVLMPGLCARIQDAGGVVYLLPGLTPQRPARRRDLSTVLTSARRP